MATPVSSAPVTTIPVSTPSNLQVTGITLMATPQGNVFSQGVPSTAVPTVPPPTTAPTSNSQVTLTTGQWIMDPSGKVVLILENNKGLSLYRVATNSPSPSTGSFQGIQVFGPVGKGGTYFLAQSDGNACVYSNSINPLWHANNGPSSAQYLFVQENGCFVTIQCKGIWGSDL